MRRPMADNVQDLCQQSIRLNSQIISGLTLDWPPADDTLETIYSNREKPFILLALHLCEGFKLFPFNSLRARIPGASPNGFEPMYCVEKAQYHSI